MTDHANKIADRVITALEGRFREWLSPQEYAEAKPLLVEIIESEMAGDARRIDWLADPQNKIGQVLLPGAVVKQNLHSLRAAIDAAMAMPRN